MDFKKIIQKVKTNFKKSEENKLYKQLKKDELMRKRALEVLKNRKPVYCGWPFGVH